MKDNLGNIIEQAKVSTEVKKIGQKVLDNQRITFDEGLTLFRKGELGYLGTLANYVRTYKNGDYVYFNRNFHIEPTNICVFDCK